MKQKIKLKEFVIKIKMEYSKWVQCATCKKLHK